MEKAQATGWISYPENHHDNMPKIEIDFKIGEFVKNLFEKIGEFFMELLSHIGSMEHGLYPEYSEY